MKKEKVKKLEKRMQLVNKNQKKQEKAVARIRSWKKQMFYGYGYREFIKKGEHKLTIKKHITKKEYDNHTTRLSEINKLNAMTNVYNLLDRNGKEFLTYSTKIKEQLEKYNEDSIGLEANRLLINYLSSLSMFIDYGEKYNKKYFDKEKLKEFQKNTNEFYDGHVSYRFMVLMRNYALHYGFPLSIIKQSISGLNGIFASKEALLQFKAWKHVKEDIEKMPNLISLDIHVEISMMFIKHLYDNYVYDIAPVVLKGIEHLNNMIKTNEEKIPILVTFKNKEEFKRGNISVNFIKTKPYQDALKIIDNHPSINIIKK